MMKFLFVPHINEVSQWKQCYYDTNSLNNLIQMIKASDSFLKLIRQQFIKANKEKKSLLKMEHISRCEFKLRELMRQCNKKFYQYSFNEIETMFIFVQMKSFETKQKIQRLKAYSQFIQRSDSDLLGLLQNAYIQVYYLKRMVSYNKAQQSSTIKQYQKNICQNQAFFNGQIVSRRTDRIYQYVRSMSEQIQVLYMLKNMKPQSKAMKQLIFYGDTSTKQSLSERFSLGFNMGVLLIMLAVLLFLKSHYNITLQQNKRYVGDFPVWRGASYLVFYQWIMGLVLLILQKSQVNYKLILQLQSQFFPKSRSIFVGAQISTIIFLIFFCIYILTLGGYIQQDFKYYGQVVWLIILAYLFIPIPFANNGGKFYFMKLLTFVVLSPIIRMNIIIIWLSEQIVSCSQPISDLAYSICKVQDYNSKCLQVPKINMIILVTIFSYRLIQNFKMVYQAGWKIVPPFYGLFRAGSSLITVVVAYNYRLDPAQYNLIPWIISAIVSTCVASFVDIKADWGFLNQSLLRKNLFFSNKPFVYYIILIINVFLRCAWVLNISPSIVKDSGILPFYFIMMVAYLELFRRGLWNILRLQFQHVNNCQKFKATVDDSLVQARVKDKYAKKGGSIYQIKSQQQREVRQKAQMQLVGQALQNREDFKAAIAKFISKKQQTLQSLAKQLATYGIKKK